MIKRQEHIEFSKLSVKLGGLVYARMGEWTSICPICRTCSVLVKKDNDGFAASCKNGCTHEAICQKIDMHPHVLIDYPPPPTSAAAAASQSATVADHPAIIRLSDVTPESVSWAWEQHIAFGKAAVLDGDPGLGKTTIGIDIAARLTTGRPMPGVDDAIPAANVLLLSAEDGLADTTQPRLVAAGADLTRVFAAPMDTHITLPGSVEWIESKVKELDIKLLEIDVLMAFLGPDVNAHKDSDVRRVMAALAGMADRTGAAVLILRHLNKASGASAVYRGGGSIGIAGAARSVLVVGRDPKDPTRCILAQAKNNLSPMAGALAYRLVDAGNGAARVEWEGAVDITADALVNQPTPSKDDQTALDQAEAFLIQTLAGSSREAREVEREADAAGIRRATLRRAKERIAVNVFKLGFGTEGRWMWSLPVEAREAVVREAVVRAAVESEPEVVV